MIAHLYLTEASSGQQGFGIRRIRQEALDWWPTGFREITGQEFSTLLDEMVGLGVLKEMEGRRYTLRNPNLLL